MEEQYFLINTNQSTDIATYDENNLKKISFTDINTLAYIASVLKTYEAPTELEGKHAALKDFFSINEYPPLKEIYELLMLNINAQRILNITIQLACLEKEFKDNGIRYLENVTNYNNLADERKKVIEYNKEMFKEEYNKNKAK